MSSYDIVNAIFNNDAVSLESLFKTTINEKIAEKLNDNKNKLEKKLFKKDNSKKKVEQPLDHMQHFNTNGKVSAKDLFVDNSQNKTNSFLRNFKMKHNIKEAEEELPLGKFNNLASEDQKHHLKSLLASGRHMEANEFIKKVLNKEDIT